MKRAGEMIRSNKQVYIKEVAAAVGLMTPTFSRENSKILWENAERIC